MLILQNQIEFIKFNKNIYMKKINFNKQYINIYIYSILKVNIIRKFIIILFYFTLKYIFKCSFFLFTSMIYKKRF